MRISGFQWDEGNWPKCGKHGLTRGEIEALFVDGSPRIYPDAIHSGTEERYLAIGQFPLTGRYALVAFAYRASPSGTLIRPISARYMHDKEVRRYVLDKQ